ncbi:uncharacterized protein N7479_007276 [Penicillium vulpinum]|uniref:Uncharacterized protein n=1 Tax=Penicillium vulpinum TaxID=29845 RepID=A0A1V6S0B7_9EURO|nr:uncharacterized protein N7479_007276 [Penicillium vulpinum]KAJ5960126.1 hypothetical protein N7479_007276 [Penicillium vulpinum]OQE07455.1 hypothetical protein PENVUL_c013G03380 [Penicillium vulpinum]
MYDLAMESPNSTPSYDSDTASEERPSSQPVNIKIQAKFRIALPPPKSNQRLRLSPKLLLQIQQLCPNHRPVPVLEIWQPPLYKSKLTKGFPQRPKLSTKDIYATLNEPYITNKQLDGQEQPQAQDIQSSIVHEKNIIAAICQPSSNNNSSSPTSSIHFRDARCIWQASVGTTGPEKSFCYKFAIKEENTTSTEQPRMIMQWEKRAHSANGDAASDDQFVLVAIDRKARRKSRIATMSRDGLEINVRKSSVLDHLRACWELAEPVSPASADLETWLYTLALTLGISVASQEGWLV